MGIKTSVCSEADLLEQYVNSSYDVIKQAVDNLDVITLIGQLNEDSEAITFLQTLVTNIDDITDVVNTTDLISSIVADLVKGNYFGNRKLDLDLSLNKTGIDADTTSSDALAIWQTVATTVYYDSATATFNDGSTLVVTFVNESGDPQLESTHSGIVAQLDDNTAFQAKLSGTNITTEIGGKVGAIIRVTDVIGQVSNLESLELNVNSGSSIDPSPIYYWAATTSALQVLADRIADVISLGDNITDIATLGNNIADVNAVADSLTQIQAIYNDLAAITAAAAAAVTAANAADAAATSATSADSSSSSAAVSAAQAAASAAAAQVAKIEWQGTWSSLTAYEVNDAVEHDDASYIAIQASTNQTPVAGGTAYWDVLARRGIDGAGSGDVVAANNLSEYTASASSARASISAQTQGDVLDDLNTLGANTADSEFLVGTAAGALAWENPTTARVSLGLGNSATLNTGTGASNVAVGNHTHIGVYEPVDATILREADLAGSGSATTPAKSDHTHSEYDPVVMSIALGG